MNKTKELPPTPQGVGEGGEGSQSSKLQSQRHDTESKDESAKPTDSARAFGLVGSTLPLPAILASYNAILPELPRAEILTASRTQTLMARISEDSARLEPDWWNRYFERVRLFPWLMGNNPNNWRASFDWLTGEDGMRKVIEGSFSQAPSQSKSDSTEEFLEFQKKYTDERGFVNARALLRDWKAKEAREARS